MISLTITIFVNIQIDFGHVVLPKDLITPAPLEAEGFVSDGSGAKYDYPLLSSKSVTLMDSNTVEIADFTYDGSVEGSILIFLKIENVEWLSCQN